MREEIRKKKFRKAIEQMIECLPDWAKSQRISVLAGLELLVGYSPGGEIEIKKVRCVKCGQCCMTLIPNHPTMTPWGVDDEGKCNALRKNRSGEWICDPPGGIVMKPYACLQGTQKSNTPECAIEFE